MKFLLTGRIAAALILISLVGGFFIRAEAVPEGRAGSASVDFIDLYANAGSVFMGETGEFYIYIQNTYDGSYWAGGSSGVAYNYLYRCRVDVNYENVIGSKGKRVDILDPAERWSLDPYNGENDRGFNITGGRYFFSDEKNNYLKFQLRFTGIGAGDYRIPLTIKFEIRRDFTDPTHTEYDYLPFTLFDYAQFSIRSNIYGVSGNTERMHAYDDDRQVPIYSGSQSILIQKNDVSSYSGREITELEALLYSPDETLIVHRARLDIGTLTAGIRDLRWSVDVADEASPGIHVVTIVYVYNVNQETMSEGPYTMEIEVMPTPIVKVTGGTGSEPPTAYIQQKENNIDLSFYVNNVGNVDLSHIKMYLDLDSASHFTVDEIYYSEDSFGAPQVKPTMVTIHNLDIGGSEIVKFRNVTLNPMLPPGIYRIPIDYEISYDDPNLPGQFIRLTSYQMDEIGIEDYVDIEYFRNHPREIKGYPPYLIVDVMDDTEGVDLQVESDTLLTPGISDQELRIMISNWENYHIDNLEFSLISSDPSILRGGDSCSEVSELLSESARQIEAGSIDGPGYLEITTRVDVSISQAERIPCYLAISGYDSFGTRFYKNISIAINLIQAMPDIEILSVKTGAVKPGSEFDLEMIITNSGTVPIGNYSVYLSSSSSIFLIDRPIHHGEGLDPGFTESLIFELEGSDEMSGNGQYPMVVMFEIETVNGQYGGFGDSDYRIITIESEDSKDTGSIEWNRGSIGFALLITFSVIIAAFCVAVLVAIYRFQGLPVHLLVNRNNGK